MKLMPLSRGLFAKVDDDDFEYLNKWKWTTLKIKNKYYAHRKDYDECILMHRLIINTPSNMETDHIDNDGLNNQKSNLRICTHSQNNWNKKKNKGSNTYKGVTWCIQKRIVNNKKYEYSYWRARITTNKVEKHIGMFKTEIEAVIAYNKAAKKYHGEFAYINSINN